MGRLELDPSQLAEAMRSGLSRNEVEDELTKFVLWRRRHRYRGDWTETWTLWIETAAAKRERRPTVPEYRSSDDGPLTKRDRTIGIEGVERAREVLRG